MCIPVAKSILGPHHMEYPHVGLYQWPYLQMGPLKNLDLVPWNLWISAAFLKWLYKSIFKHPLINGHFRILDWRYLPYIRPMYCKAYVREYPHKIWPYMVQYLHFRILEISHRLGRLGRLAPVPPCHCPAAQQRLRCCSGSSAHRGAPPSARRCTWETGSDPRFPQRKTMG